MSRAVHRFALLVAIATFFLIIAGANVTSHDAGLATSDWPLSNGQVFPRMVGNLFWEHGHRLVATTVGLLTIALAIVLQIRERRSWVKRLGWVALAGVIAQGLLGASSMNRDAGQVRTGVEQLQFLGRGRFGPGEENRQHAQVVVAESANRQSPTGTELKPVSQRPQFLPRRFHG